jgi:pimeloyl-ACP methyl ester carboxylesterase
MLAHDRSGSGPALVLLHFLGGHRRVWDVILPHLTGSRRVVALDLPGFGGSRPVAGTPTMGRLTDAVADTLAELELQRAVAISPVGFAARAEAAYARASLRATHAACRAIAGQAERLAGQTAVRAALGAQMFARPWALPAEDAADLVRSVAHSPGMLPVLRAAMGHETAAGALTTPVTVAWGHRDALMRPRQGIRAVERLPFARLVPLAGCGHVPLWDDPERVARVVLDGAGDAGV